MLLRMLTKTRAKKRKTDENNESFWPMDLLRLNKGILKPNATPPRR